MTKYTSFKIPRMVTVKMDIHTYSYPGFAAKNQIF